MDRKAIMIFGLGSLQKSLIQQCHELGLYTVGIDVTDAAVCKDDVDVFDVIAGDDFESTLALAKRYQIKGIVTAATDKPLVMMARVSEELNLPFYSVNAAQWSTDKLQMKKRFQAYGIPCAKGMEVSREEEVDGLELTYPVIMKPRDNSGSRGVIYCQNRNELVANISEVYAYTSKQTVLVEEYIDGKEYSIESLHYHGKTHLIQFTEKITTDFPYNVELGHIQPAFLTEDQREEIVETIERIAVAMRFDNCASHTELKINSNGIVVIETSPRLGGDFITSILVPLSTGINMERLLVRMSIEDSINDEDFEAQIMKSSGVTFFELAEGQIVEIDDFSEITSNEECKLFQFDKVVGDKIRRITNSLERYGYAVFQTDSREETQKDINRANEMIRRVVTVK